MEKERVRTKGGVREREGKGAFGKVRTINNGGVDLLPRNQTSHKLKTREEQDRERR